jgi:DNA-binding NarL/FixJ family response regulator
MVVDDHEPSLEKVCRELASAGVIQVIAKACTSDEAWKVAQKLLPDIILLDLHLPGLISQPELIKRLNSLRQCRIVAFASEGKASEVQSLFESGVAAYVLKSDAPELLRMSLLMVSRGSKEIVSPAMPRFLSRLSSNERAILHHITKRGGLPKAAERLGINETDINDAVEHLMEKLDVSEVTQLIKWAKKHGF